MQYSVLVVAADLFIGEFWVGMWLHLVIWFVGYRITGTIFLFLYQEEISISMFLGLCCDLFASLPSNAVPILMVIIVASCDEKCR